MEWLQLLSWACIVFTIGMFSTGLSDLKKMLQSKSTENIQFLPFLTTCLNNLGWLYYGNLKTDATLEVVNAIGAQLQILYIFYYYKYTDNKKMVVSHITVAGLILMCGWFYFSMLLPAGETRLNQLGFTCSVVTIAMYLSPLASLVEILQTHNVQCLSVPLTVSTLLTSMSWVLYGLQMSDCYIVVPNLPGIITSLIRFFLFWKFGFKNQNSPSYAPLKI